jgi:hypothetical protein
MTPKLTPWFHAGEKPVREGVYMLRDGFGKQLGYQYWDGVSWHCWCESIGGARLESTADRECQNDPWRGLSQEPTP